MLRKSNHSKKDSDRLNASTIIDMNGNQFPFGQLSSNSRPYDQTRKIFVRKRVVYKTQNERILMDQKLNVLKNMCHRNVINIRGVDEAAGEVKIYYNYVPFTLQSAFSQLNQQTFKELHKQIIQLAIHLAKNYILTSFNATRCGILFVDGKFLIKYYLPLNEIVLTQNISMLERSVQLFKVQAMHILDTLCNHDILTDLNSSRSEQDQLRTPDFKASLVVSRARKMSNQTGKNRKFSNFNHKLSEIKRKKSHDSTAYTEMRLSGLKETLNNFKMKSQRKRTSQQSKQKTRQRVQLLKVRSARALKIFQSCKKQIIDYRGLWRLIRLCNYL